MGYDNIAEYFIQYLPTPVTHQVKHPRKGDGLHQDSRHKVVTELSGSGMMYGNGCLRHNCSDCEQCPMPDCDYSPTLEAKLRRQK